MSDNDCISAENTRSIDFVDSSSRFGLSLSKKDISLDINEELSVAINDVAGHFDASSLPSRDNLYAYLGSRSLNAKHVLQILEPPIFISSGRLLRFI